MVDKQRMAAPGHPERKPFVINIQEAGGIRKTVERAAQEVAKLLPIANEARRTPQPVSELIARHQLRRLRRQLRHHRQPGARLGRGRARRATAARACSAETPEIYGAEHLLIRRAVNEGVAKKLHRSVQVVGVVLPRASRRWTTTPRPATRRAASPRSSRSRSAASPRAGTTPMTDVFLLRRADHHARLRVHGHAGPRPGVDHRPGRRRRNIIVFTTGPRLRLRLQARALASSSRRTRSCTATWRTTWTSTAA